MPYYARTANLSEMALTGGLVDPRAQRQATFSDSMSCRDVKDFSSNLSTFPSWCSTCLKSSNGEPFSSSSGPCCERPTRQAERTRARSGSMTSSSELGTRKNEYRHPIWDHVPQLVFTGGLSRSPAFDCLPVVSHWADRTGEASAEDPDATILLSSTWETVSVVAEGVKMDSPFGAPCWSLKTHGIGLTKAGLNKFSQRLMAEKLVTTVTLPQRIDTPQTGGLVTTCASVSWMRNARVADAVDCAVGLLSDSAALLAARHQLVTTGTDVERLTFAEVRSVTMPTWSSARKPLPPKFSGLAIPSDASTVRVIEAEDCKGPLLNASIFSMALGYNRGVYGGSISGLWSMMDSSFVLDYSIGVHDASLADNLSSAFADVAAMEQVAVSAGPHITDIRIVKSSNYSCLRQKTIIEDGPSLPSRPCIVIWNDLARLARYKLADAAFCHVYYDSGGGEQMAAMAGLGCAVHDWIDLGSDMACGEVSNIIPSLTGGSLDEEPLAEVYSRLVGAMIWYRDNDPYNPAALCILYTHWWQLANCRHRPIALLGRTDIGIDAAIGATMPKFRPSIHHFRASGTQIKRGQEPFSNAEARLESLLASNPLSETRTVAHLLVEPVLAYVSGRADSLPTESEYLDAILAAELAYPQGQKIMELWDLSIVMWESGAMWAAGVAGLCYTHTGNFNSDRAREDLSDATWT